MPDKPDEGEVTSLSVGGVSMRLLNGEKVTARLRREGRAGRLAAESEALSDLIPDVYEGGMKLWECATDLATFLEREVPVAGLHVTELGCGAAVPALHCMLRGAATACLQDYNGEVIDHLTLPNLALNLPADRLSCCRAFSGDWGALAARLRAPDAPPASHLVVSSETIYSSATWTRLLDAVDAALRPDGVALLAAKTFYFGVGGGTRAFESAVAADGRFTSAVVFSTELGLQREILRLKRV